MVISLGLGLRLGLTPDPGARNGGIYQGLVTPHHFSGFIGSFWIFQGFARVGDIFQGFGDTFQGFGDTVSG